MKPAALTPTAGRIFSPQEKIEWLRLCRSENVGPVTFYRLLGLYGTARKALEKIPDLSRQGGARRPLRVIPADEAAREYEGLTKAGGSMICAGEEAYPLSLAALDDAPPVISVLGDAGLCARPCIGVVGSRNASLNGRKFTERMAQDLGRAGVAVVSGLARGIDTAAHTGSLATGTIAVVAGGIDVIYPPENKDLYARISGDGGLIVAESPFGQEPFAQSFPRRNRIISGLSQGVVVVEATMRSGSLITARLAGEQGRDVYAVPGHPLDPRAEGPNHLIREGAILVRGAMDVLEAMQTFGAGHPVPAAQESDAFLSDGGQGAFSEDDAAQVRAELLAALSLAPVQVDELVRAAGLPVAAVQVAVIELELAGRLSRLPGNRVVLVS